MAWKLLPTNYTDAVWDGLKKYNQINNSDGTISLQDMTVYSGKENSFFGALDANRMNEALNTIMSMVDNGTDLYEAFQIYFATQKTLFKAEGNETIETIKADYRDEITKFESAQEQDFDTWFESMKGQLSEDAAGNLQTQLDAHTGNENIHITTTEREKWNAGSLVSGSNELGSYLKFPDGTMLEWGTAVDEAVPANGQKQKSVAFPIAFNGIPSVTATAEADTSKGAITTQIGSIAKTIVYIYAYNTAPVDRTVPIHWQAIGRWK